MKEWFPFTNYDFYAYLACGVMVLFALDYWHTGGYYMIQIQWGFSRGLLAISLAYITGQLVAILASALLESSVTRYVLRSPTRVLIDTQCSRLEKIINTLIGRYYAPFPQGVREKIFARAERSMNLSTAQIIANPEELFLPAYHFACKEKNAKVRMNDFRNQYGFNRNMAMSGFLVSILMFHRAFTMDDPHAWSWGIFALMLSVGMFIRFWKFYCSFAAEILRTYAFEKDL